jgi:hypothetical protein
MTRLHQPDSAVVARHLHAAIACGDQDAAYRLTVAFVRRLRGLGLPC